MSINLVAVSSDLKKQKEIGFIETEFSQILEQIINKKVTLMRYISPCEKTYFNKKQLSLIKKRIVSNRK